MTLQQLIQYANNNPIKFNHLDYLSGIKEMHSASALLQLIIYDYEHADYEERPEVLESIKNSLNLVLYCAKEPTFNNSHNWGYPMLCQAIALIKNKTELWEIFSTEEQEKLTMIMKMFALMWNFGCNAYNKYATGIGLKGNFGKNSGSNYRLSNNIIMAYLIPFFGELHNINLFFEHTSYDTIINNLKRLGFYNAFRTWTTPSFLLPDGTKAPGARELYSTREAVLTGLHNKAYQIDIYKNVRYLGNGQGCRLIYHYCPFNSNKEVSNTNIQDLIDDVLLECFSGGKVFSSIYVEDEDEYCCMPNGLVSPYEGQEGMMKEFNIPDDSMGLRSSVFHCEIDFILVTSALTTLRLLGVLDPKELPYWNKINVGMNDFLFKKENNYRGYAMGSFEQGRKELPLEYWKNYWLNNFADI